MPEASVDCVYVAACAADVRLLRICIASIRYFYPHLPVRVLAGGALPRGLARELSRWRVDIADLPQGNYGWGFVKLEPLFGPAGERFLVLDADTVVVGPVLELLPEAPVAFVVDDEQHSDVDCKRLYYDWDQLALLEPAARRPLKPFNSGQWFGTAGIVAREAFDPYLEWSMPRRHRHPEVFMGGDQGLLNFVLDKASAKGVAVEARKLMVWPGRPLEDLSCAQIFSRTARPAIIHWAGVKGHLLHGMVGGDILQRFEQLYFAALPMGRLRRRWSIVQHLWRLFRRDLGGRVTLVSRRLAQVLQPSAAGLAPR